ncbi:hypothetical protein [Aureivirga sp. CE67]|uniref:hypothetical protein n=1 Tax=Aureivirga sp. CE67 TaxID=1788983 RepID=UPI0018CA232B|nr:hypothetical protein [Aureivirga sp. CE67]
MIEEKFIEISEELNCNYRQENTKYNNVLSGSNLPVTDHYLEIEYKDSFINLSYEFGSQNIAEIITEIELKQPKEDFEISTRSHFKRLFVQNKSPWKIKNSNPVLKGKILKLLEESKLTEIANESTFEPLIKGKGTKNRFELTTRYSLAFENKEESILPIINLNKRIIDLLLE